MQLLNMSVKFVIGIFIAFHGACSLIVNSQVIFGDEEVPPRRQQSFGGNNVLVISIERPNQPQQGFRRPPQQQQQQSFQGPGQNGFRDSNSNNGFRNPNSAFSSASASSNFGFQQQRPNNNQFQGNPGFHRPRPNDNFQRPNQQQQSGSQIANEVEIVVVKPRQPDCRTYLNTDGYCQPLNACGSIVTDIQNQNRSPTVIARILGRSLCGFNGIIPKVCCPLSRFQQTQPPRQQQNFTPKPFNPNRPSNNNNFGGGGGGSVGGNNFNNGNNKPPPGFGNSGDGNNGNGGGLVIIPPPSTTTTTTPPSLQIIEPVKKPGGNSGGGLIIGDGPIALVPHRPDSENSTDPLGFSDKGLPADCGFSDAKHTRIIGGKTAEKGAFPWISAIGYKDQAGNVNYLCGGALISPLYVITASHCVYEREDLATVRLGDHDLFSTADGVTPLEVEVDKKILHPNYDPATFKNDIALLRLKRPVPYSRQIHPICLPSTPQLRNQKFENTSPFVAGWGAIQFNGPSSSVLREVQVPVVPDSVCQEKYSTFKSAVVDNSNICAGLQTGGKDACQGDSGGPLQQPIGTNKYVLIGIVSFGYKCAEPGFPGVYSRVTSHLDWIQSTANL